MSTGRLVLVTLLKRRNSKLKKSVGAEASATGASFTVSKAAPRTISVCDATKTGHREISVNGRVIAVTQHC